MKKRNFLAVLASCAVMASMFSVTANAANYADENQAAGGNTTFTKYLVLDAEANVPNATFKYTIAAGTAIDGTADNMQVYAGKFAVNGEGEVTAPVVSDVTFTAGNSTTDGADGDGITNDASKKYASQTINADFTGVKFDEPGVYRYIVTEDLNGSQGVAVAGSIAKTLDVFVEDGGTGTLSVKSYVLYNTVINTAPDKITAVDKNADKTAEDGKKTDGFVNTYDTNDLTLSKTVTGNQGSKDKYFKFEVTIKNAVAGTVYDVDLTSADGTVIENSATNAEYVGKANPTSVTVGDDGTVTETFYLQNGQSIKILGLAEGTAYEIEETPEDYVASAVITGDTERTADSSDVALLDNKVFDTELTEDTTVAFTNDRQGTIPTGVILSVAAPVAIGVAVLGGIVFLFIRNKKRDAEQEE